MTTQTLAPAATPRRTRLLTPRDGRAFLVPAVVAVAFVVTEGLIQAVIPFIRQDDWPFLVPPHTAGVSSAGAHDLSEGRWLNTVYWALIGQHGTAASASITYAVGYAALVIGMWRVLHRAGIRPRPAVDALLGVAVFSSSVWVQLLYWPGTLTPSVLVAAVAIWTLPWVAPTPARLGRGSRFGLVPLLAWVLLGEAAAVLTYPPIGAVLLVFAVVVLREAPWRQVLAVAGTWAAGFAAGVGVAYTLNWLQYGHFGLQIAPWRHPNPGSSLHALGVNAGRWLAAAGGLWAAQWWAALVAVVGIVLGLRDATVRPWLQRTLLALALVGALDAAQTLATGIVTENRGQLWTWYVALLPAALLLVGRRRLHGGVTDGRGLPVHRVAVGLLAVLAVGGVLAWRADIGEHQATRQQYAALAAAATAPASDGTRPTVVVYQDPALRHTRSGKIMASTLRMAVRQDQDGVLPLWCTPSECRAIAAGARARRGVVDLGPVGGVPDVVGVVVPTPPSWI